MVLLRPASWGCLTKFDCCIFSRISPLPPYNLHPEQTLKKKQKIPPVLQWNHLARRNLHITRARLSARDGVTKIIVTWFRAFLYFRACYSRENAVPVSRAARPLSCIIDLCEDECNAWVFLLQSTINRACLCDHLLAMWLCHVTMSRVKLLIAFLINCFVGESVCVNAEKCACAICFNRGVPSATSS